MVGFPVAPKDSVNISLVDAVRSLVPEARVFQHDIFRNHVLAYDQNTDLESEIDASSLTSSDHPCQMGFEQSDSNDVPGATPALDTSQHDSSRCVLESTHGNMVPTVPTFKGPPKRSVAYSASGMSSSLLGASGHAVFSPAWIRDEALDLLGRIHQDAPQKHEHDLGRVVLAGYGPAGIIVKQV